MLSISGAAPVMCRVVLRNGPMTSHIALKTKTKLACYAGVGVILLALSLHALWLSQPPPRNVGFCFLGNPTARATGVLAFSITNASGLDVLYGVFGPQVKSNGVWLEELGPTPGMGPPQTLPARQSGTLLVAPPSHNEAWRVPVIWVYAPTVADRLKVQENKLLDKLIPRSQPRLHMVQVHTNYSPKVGP
jgi:hypothetical protein